MMCSGEGSRSNGIVTSSPVRRSRLANTPGVAHAHDMMRATRDTHDPRRCCGEASSRQSGMMGRNTEMQVAVYEHLDHAGRRATPLANAPDVPGLITEHSGCVCA